MPNIGPLVPDPILVSTSDQLLAIDNSAHGCAGHASMLL